MRIDVFTSLRAARGEARLKREEMERKAMDSRATWEDREVRGARQSPVKEPGDGGKPS